MKLKLSFLNGKLRGSVVQTKGILNLVKLLCLKSMKVLNGRVSVDDDSGWVVWEQVQPVYVCRHNI